VTPFSEQWNEKRDGVFCEKKKKKKKKEKKRKKLNKKQNHRYIIVFLMIKLGTQQRVLHVNCEFGAAFFSPQVGDNGGKSSSGGASLFGELRGRFVFSLIKTPKKRA
jgi:hypothetical protein